jgi:hypothetical protein
MSRFWNYVAKKTLEGMIEQQAGGQLGLRYMEHVFVERDEDDDCCEMEAPF